MSRTKELEAALYYADMLPEEIDAGDVADQHVKTLAAEVRRLEAMVEHYERHGDEVLVEGARHEGRKANEAKP